MLFLKLMTLISCTLLLTQCTTTTPATTYTPPINTQQKLVDPYFQPAPAYLYLAKNQTGKEQQALLIKAAGRLIKEGRWQEGRRILSQTNDLSPELINEKSLLLAQIALMSDQPRVAIGLLTSIHDSDHLSPYEQVQYHEHIASAYEAMGSSLAAVSERIQLDSLLPDDASKAANRTHLWSVLIGLPPEAFTTLTPEENKSKLLMGWVQLVQIAHTNHATAHDMLAAVEQWQIKYPQHPANNLLPSPLPATLFNPPKKIALLLPLTGPLAGPGGAVKEGFMASLEASQNADSVKVGIYNTNNAQIAALYQQAVDEGANYIVGPLSKAEVATIAAIPHPVPTLLLNDADSPVNDNTYQLSLSPSHEAQQVAIKAHKKGYSRALVIAPAGGWGNEVVMAFENEWQQKGGRVVDSLRYRANDDMNADFRHFLHLTKSEARVKQLKELLGQTIESTPARRQDFDVIFLLAYSSKARQIIPLLNYYYAGDVPVYATSSVYAGVADAKRDRDLDGLLFCDMPWVFSHQIGNKNWPEQFNSYNRLYALGRDSYELSTQLNQLILFSSMKVNDKSDVLYLTSKQKIVRNLAWGQFKNGLAQKII